MARKLRANDQFIMDLVMNQDWSKQKVDSVNACRRYLQATTLADITNDRGTEIDQQAWDGSRITTKETYTGVLFNQIKPGNTAWGAWRQFLRTLCRDHRRLRIPLGLWLVQSKAVRHPTTWVYDHQNNNLYRQVHGHQYQKCVRVSSILFHHPTPGTEPQLTPPGRPTWVLDTPQNIRPMHAFQISPPLPPIPLRFHEYIGGLAEWERSLLGAWTMPYGPEETMRRLNDGPITCASDGSVRTPSATFGCVLCDHRQVRLVSGKGPAPGSDPNSLRSEAYGNLATFQMLVQLSRFTRTPLQSTIRQVVDSQVLIRRVEQAFGSTYDNPSVTLKAEWDVVQQIVGSTESFLHQPTYKWIKGHQDDHTAYDRLPYLAQINCDADALATSYYQQMPQPVIKEPTLPSNPATLEIQHQSITSKYKTKIRRAYTIPALRKYLCHRFQWEDAHYDYVAWDLFAQIIDKFHSQHTTIAKHVHAIAPTGHIAHRNKNAISPNCPSCDCDSEDNNHVLTCPATSRANWRVATLASLAALRHDRSDPILKHLIQDGLSRFHEGIIHIDETLYPARYQPLIQQQNSLGWDQLYRGRWSHQWSELHTAYAQDKWAWTGQDKDGKLWVLHHGRKLIDHWLELWSERNKEKHGADQDSRQRARHSILTNEMSAIYALRPAVVPRDRQLFYATAEQHFQAHPNLDVIEDWILTHRSAIMASATQAQQFGIQHNRTIHDYFPRRDNAANREIVTGAVGSP